MTYAQALKMISDLLYKKYRLQIQNQLYMYPDFWEDKKVLLQKLPGLDKETLQQYLDAMYDAGMINKDDGVTVGFSVDYIKSLKLPSYF